MTILIYILSGVLSFYLLWIFYLAVMNLKRVRDLGKLTKVTTFLGFPILILGYLIDFICNVFFLTIILLELPQETTVTARLKRHNKTSTGWRLAVVKWFEPIVDPFDPSGDHI